MVDSTAVLTAACLVEKMEWRLVALMADLKVFRKVVLKVSYSVAWMVVTMAA